MRCYEQFRNGPVFHGLPVRVIGMGGGFSYGHAGPSHFSLEDLALARLQPGALALAPVDSAQTRSILLQLQAVPGPAYLRLDKTEEPDIPALNGLFAFNAPQLVRPGNDLLLLSTGSIAQEALKASDLLQNHGIAAAVAVQAHLSFRAEDALIDLLRTHRAVVTVEEAFRTGGLGSLVAEAIAVHGLSCRLCNQGVNLPLDGVTGSREYMRRRHGLDATSLADRARLFLQELS